MGFGLFKKKEEDVPDDIGFETPPTLANPAGFSNAPNLPQTPGLPQTPNLPQMPQPPAPQQPMAQTQYTPPYAPNQNYNQNYNPDVENQIKLMQTKIESINVQLNTISQKLDYLINMLRSSQGYKY